MSEATPTVSAIMPTYNRRDFVRQAIEYFSRQDYPAAARELIVVDDGEQSVADLTSGVENIRYFRLDRRASIGAKRNFACAQARGEIIVHWDDDDWSAPHRISSQIGSLGSADVCGLANVLYFDPKADRAWEYRYPHKHRAWVSGNSMCYRKSFWERNSFPDINVGEDARFLWSGRQMQLVECPDGAFLVGIIHSSNVSPKCTGGSYWKAARTADVHERIGADLSFYAKAGTHKRALVTAARGIGDILRTTPLIRVMARLGYQVDVALEPDYAETVELIRGAPEIESLYWRGSPWARERADHSAGLRDQRYDVAMFTTWSSTLRPLVKASEVFSFERNAWMQNGDSSEVERIARLAGWHEPLPAPFAMASDRTFEIPAGTIALHPGCKPDWPWKKWHGFDELARELPEVALIGTPGDLNNAGTYFKRSFEWPDHARNFIGQLNLPDTAALLQQCAGLVSNDSGMMQLAVALNIPTWGIFGITSPEREGVPAPNFFPITKGLSCEPACRKERWGRRDCEHHLECLRTLEPAEVLQHIRADATPRQPTPKQRTPDLDLVYYGEVFNASGYGAAARAYVHALHAAGMKVSVVNTGGPPAAVRDPLVESLLGNSRTADFHLFHGIPTTWAQQAFRCSNAIGMTVWETDTMPTQWASTLNHVMEVWLPCDHNIAAFERGVHRPLFKLPHVFRPPVAQLQSPDESRQLSRVRPDVFVIYSIFEWQERKMPLGQLTAYLRAFPRDGEHVLVLKVNASAARAANEAVREVRRQTGSTARVEIFAEVWSDAEIDALHERGDCYLSLHRGEGWCYPLFDAVCRGNAGVATGYSGPLEYLTAEHHELIRYKLAPVTQRYAFYHPRMNWADPDLDHAADRLQWVFHNRTVAAERARVASETLRTRYSSESVGEMARERLLELKKKKTVVRSPAPATRVQPAPRRSVLCAPRHVPVPPVPIPASWYNADYFENGLTSNWKNGYRWDQFQGLFRDTASFLTESFPGASSFLDAGCAKGFLVRTLREKQKEAWGFDASSFAIDRAGETSQWVRVGDVDNVEWDCQFDVLLALDLLSHLTEQQATDFLKRARMWTRQSVLATIPLTGDFRPGSRDFTHITHQNRQWWHNLFLRAGWRQHPAQHSLQRRPVPVAMQWNVFCYAPD